MKIALQMTREATGNELPKKKYKNFFKKIQIIVDKQDIVVYIISNKNRYQ